MITTNQELRQLLPHLKSVDMVAVDTEFLRIDSYYPRPCLIQIATHEQVVAIDLTLNLDMGEFFAVLFDKLLILHSGRQDLELLYVLTKKLPQQIFDTQIFAHFLGYQNQVAYGVLVQDVLGVELDKAYSHYDWSSRPLPIEVLQYALDDVIYLYQLHDKFKTSKYYDFAFEDSQDLLDVALYQLDVQQSYKYLRGRGRLNKPQLNLAARICGYREHLASLENKPRRWVIDDDAILKMATTGCIPDEIIQGLPELEHIASPDNKVPTFEERNQIKSYQKLFKKQANAYNLPPEVMANKKQILKFIRGSQNVPFTKGWRKQILGDLNE
jgi:ribonuclease D